MAPYYHRFKAAAYLSVVADHLHPFMATACRMMHHLTELRSSQTSLLGVIVKWLVSVYISSNSSTT